MSDTGLVSSTCHTGTYKQKGGTATGTSPTASSVEAGTIVPCAFCQCSVTLGIAPVSFPANAIWDQEYDYSLQCPAVKSAGSPIMLALGGKWELSSLKDGVTFDFFGTGHPIQMAWTAKDSDNAILVLPNKGIVNSSFELVGDEMRQPTSDDPNGFRALAQYDDNHDGVIDQHDKIWTFLRWWINRKHDGIAHPDELYTMEKLGVYSIGLKYHEDRWVDKNGNAFRYRGRVNVHGEPTGDNVDRTIYDVFFRLEPGAYQAAHHPTSKRISFGEEPF